jgi:hypothetical protein
MPDPVSTRPAALVAWTRAARRGAARTAALVLAAAAVAAPAGRAAAQERDTTAAARPAALQDPRLVPGTRIRVTLRNLRDARFTGRIDSVLAQAFVLDTADRRSVLFIAPAPELLPPFRQARIRYDDIERLEISRGASRTRGAVIGGLIGAAAGGLLTSLNDTPQLNPSGRDVGRAAVGGVIVGGLLGGLVGAWIARERWATLPWP